MKNLAALVVILLPLAGQAPSPGGEPAARVAVTGAASAGLEQTLEVLGYDVLGAGAAGSVELVVSAAEQAALQASGFSVQVLEVAGPLGVKLAGLDIPAGYHDLAAINGALQAAEAAYPGLAQVVDVAAVYGPGSSFEGRPLLALKISDNVAASEDEPRVLIASCHHAREIVTPEIALDIIGRLTGQYGVDPQITAIVDGYEIWVLPVANPDGLDYVWTTNDQWRKNRSPQGSVFGVDQNRNYDLGWSGSCAGSTNPSSSTYKGPAAGSEAETQSIVGLSLDRNFAKVLDFHSSGREVLLSYLCSPMPGLQEGWVDAEGLALAALAAGYGTREPSAEGEHQEWQLKVNTSYAYLVETQTSFQPAYSEALSEANLVWPLVLSFLSRAIPLQGHVTDSLSGAPVSADITVSGIAWQLGESRRSEPGFGRYHLFLPPGTWQVSFSAPGYQAKTEFVSVTAVGEALRDVSLTPQASAFTLDFSTTGGGALDLTLGLNNVPAAVTTGYCLLSLDTAGAVGGGYFVGLYPDITTFECLGRVPTPGDLLAWTWPVAAPLFPAVPLAVPAGAVPLPVGTAVDCAVLTFGAGGAFFHLTPVSRVVF